MIPVTQPFLPPLEHYNKLLTKIWDRRWLTNMGPINNELELKLKKYLDVKHLSFVTNGTIALQIAIKSLELKGEIITTPFSYVATTSSIVWEGCTPVFVDIESSSLNIDHTKIETAITTKTTAILATHVYGNPCNVLAIEKIAEKYNLKVIYDGAHAFGVNLDGRSIFNYGDVSICSTHATKLYHTVEGGFLVTKCSELIEKIFYMRNFGHNGPESFKSLGINGKNSELHAAIGIINLNYIKSIREKRKKISERYNYNLKSLNLNFPRWHENANKNYAYYPILFKNESNLLDVVNELTDNNIYARRYFYPSLDMALPYVNNQNLVISKEISKRVLCLPLYYQLSINQVDLISRIIDKKLSS